MTTETNSAVADTGGGGLPAMSPDEEAFFSSGGESAIPGGEAGGSDAGAVIPDKAAAPAADAKAPQHVPLAALHEERGKRKGLEKETRELREKVANFEGRFAVLDRLAPKDGAAKDGKPVEQPAGPIDPEVDVFGAVRQVGETLTQLQKRMDEDKANGEAAKAQNTFVNDYRTDASTFETKTPDYKAAYNHLLNSRASELIAIGFDDPKALQDSGADAETVNAAGKALHDALIADEFAIAERAFKAKKSPAEIIYNLAKQRGYTGKAPAAAAAADVAKPKGEEVLDAIERGQAANKSLNNAGGGPVGDDMTAERLVAMPMPEYEAWVEKNPAKARALMGG